MKTVSVTAYFDGKQIQLDEPLDLKPNTKLMVTVLSDQESDRETWQAIAIQGLERAYTEEDEVYDLSDVKTSNPSYERS